MKKDPAFLVIQGEQNEIRIRPFRNNRLDTTFQQKNNPSVPAIKNKRDPDPTRQKSKEPDSTLYKNQFRIQTHHERKNDPNATLKQSSDRDPVFSLQNPAYKVYSPKS